MLGCDPAHVLRGHLGDSRRPAVDLLDRLAEQQTLGIASGEGALAVETACRVEDLLGTVHPHPTLVESLHEAVAVARRRLSRERT